MLATHGGSTAVTQAQASSYRKFYVLDVAAVALGHKSLPGPDC